MEIQYQYSHSNPIIIAESFHNNPYLYHVSEISAFSALPRAALGGEYLSRFYRSSNCECHLSLMRFGQQKSQDNKTLTYDATYQYDSHIPKRDPSLKEIEKYIPLETQNPCIFEGIFKYIPNQIIHIYTYIQYANLSICIYV